MDDEENAELSLNVSTQRVPYPPSQPTDSRWNLTLNEEVTSPVDPSPITPKELVSQNPGLRQHPQKGFEVPFSVLLLSFTAIFNIVWTNYIFYPKWKEAEVVTHHAYPYRDIWIPPTLTPWVNFMSAFSTLVSQTIPSPKMNSSTLCIQYMHRVVEQISERFNYVPFLAKGAFKAFGHSLI